MMIVAKETCPKCQKGDQDLIVTVKKKRTAMCLPCYREYHPPTMTLVDFTDGGHRMLWNIEVGDYETFGDIEDIEWCGWIVRSKQKTLYRHVPRVVSVVYHLEFHGTVACGRCVDYKFFDSDATQCMSVGCEKLAKPWRDKKDMQFPPERSKYSLWSERLSYSGAE